MANTAGYVTTGKPNISGAIWVAPKGTTLPTDATTALDGAFVCLGYVSEDGLENNNELSVSAIKAWGGNIVYRSLDEMTDEFKFALIETENVNAKKAVYGDDNVTVDGSGNISVNVVAGDPVEKVWVFELALRNGVAHRMVVPDGAITAREAITYNDSDPVAYGITVSAYPDSSGKTHQEFTEPVTISL